MSKRKKNLVLDLDSFWGEYFYTKYDIGGSGHSITIRAEDKENFINAFCAVIRERLEESLEDEYVDDDDTDENDSDTKM